MKKITQLKVFLTLIIIGFFVLSLFFINFETISGYYYGFGASLLISFASIYVIWSFVGKTSEKGYIIGFHIMIEKPGTYRSEESLRGMKSLAIASCTILSSQVIHHKNSREKLESDLSYYDMKTGIATFMFPKMKHEMELPERFIEKANDFIMYNKNSEVIYIFF